ncbi:PLP-dependent aminotransferase family protein [Pseudomonas sp. LABIM340]|uniref:aminotransferase-like domain-containing protein n=1 Tax=Pseudomonas sp. LABIM340 TaxID=3156585 RepID=UPI0032AFACD2
MHRYQQLAAELADAIRSGRLSGGCALPSLRECASQRGMSLNTVTAAYRLLEDQGLVEARPQSGFYVSSTLAEPRQSLRRTPTLATGRHQESLMTRVFEAEHRGGYFNLALACPGGKPFYPGEKLNRLTSNLLRRRSEIATTYALPPGSSLLREQIARRSLRLGMQLDASSVLITHGATEALQLALRAVTQPGDAVGIEAPAYYNLYPLLKSLGLRALEIPTHPRDGLDLDSLEPLLEQRRIAAVVATPTVHNPLGSSMPLDAKRRLAGLLRQYRTPLIEDIVYAELQFADPPDPTVRSFDSEGWVLVCSGFSKTLAPDYRIGWLEAGRYASRVQALKWTSSGCESSLLSEAVGLYLESGGYEHHIRNLRRLYAVQIDQARGLIARHFPEGTCATRPSGGFLLWVELPPEVDSLDLFERAFEAGVVIMPGQVYSEGARYRQCFRMSCCQVIDAAYADAIATLGRLAHEISQESNESRIA